MALYPNPAESDFFFTNPFARAGELEIKIYDIQGRVLIKEHTILSPLEKAQVDISSLDPGIKFVEIKKGENIYIRKLISM